jgi:CrcB protein
VHPLVRPFLGVGVLGGFTTFSTTLLESARLADGGGPWDAAGYLLGTTAGALLAVHVGVRGAQRVGRGR